MQTFNISLSSTEVDNFDITALGYAASLMSGGVVLSFNPSARDTTISGIAASLAEYLAGAPLIIRNAALRGGYGIVCPAADPASAATARFAQNITLQPGVEIQLAWDTDGSGMWTGQILKPDTRMWPIAPGNQQIGTGPAVNGVTAYIFPAGYATGTQGGIPGY